MRHFVPIGYTEEELAYARRFQEVITELDKEGLKDLISILSGRDKEKKRQMEESPMLDFVLERHVSFGGGGSTDVGDVSWVVPTGKVDINCYAAGTALHSWQAVAQGKAPAAHKGMLTAAKIMGLYGSRAAGEAGASGKNKGGLAGKAGRRDVSGSPAKGCEAGDLVKNRKVGFYGECCKTASE